MVSEIRDRSILLTRPRLQAQALVTEVSRLGAKAIQLPVIEIEALPLGPADKQKIIDLDRYDLILVVSVNAASIGMEWIDRYWPQLPSHIDWFAVGQASAGVLQLAGVNVLVPAQQSNSEGLLALPELQHLDEQRILILKGVGGRVLLAEQLQQRGGLVATLDLYQRRLPNYSSQQIVERVGTELPDTIVVTSVEILNNMHRLLSPCYKNLISVNLVTASKRISTVARDLGYLQVKTAGGASDQKILEALDERI